MKTIKLIYFLFIFCSSLYSQQNNKWVAFWDDEKELLGFKDRDGNVVIEPKFTNFTIAKYFDNIIAVAEDSDGILKTYYLSRGGKIFGRDSLYISDNSPDCESEGYIRFRDKETDKVGMFNSKGEVVIPAEYNDLTAVQNGLIIALKGAEKKYWDDSEHPDRDHFSWTGGKEYLIDTNNRIIIEDFRNNSYLNLYSFKLESSYGEDTDRRYYQGLNGKYYSFIDYEKEFNNWLILLLDRMTEENLLEASFEQISYWDEPDGWVKEAKEDFIGRNFKLLKSKLLELKNRQTEYFISIEGPNPYIFDPIEFEKYFNDCGEAKVGKYPVINLVINQKTEAELSQNQFDFLRTEDGYKLISLTIRNGNLR